MGNINYDSLVVNYPSICVYARDSKILVMYVRVVLQIICHLTVYSKIQELKVIVILYPACEIVGNSDLKKWRPVRTYLYVVTILGLNLKTVDIIFRPPPSPPTALTTRRKGTAEIRLDLPVFSSPYPSSMAGWAGIPAWLGHYDRLHAIPCGPTTHVPGFIGLLFSRCTDRPLPAVCTG